MVCAVVPSVSRETLLPLICQLLVASWGAAAGDPAFIDVQITSAAAKVARRVSEGRVVSLSPSLTRRATSTATTLVI
jgi:hypothetical protein